MEVSQTGSAPVPCAEQRSGSPSTMNVDISLAAADQRSQLPSRVGGQIEEAAICLESVTLNGIDSFLGDYRLRSDQNTTSSGSDASISNRHDTSNEASQLPHAATVYPTESKDCRADCSNNDSGCHDEAETGFAVSISPTVASIAAPPPSTILNSVSPSSSVHYRGLNHNNHPVPPFIIDGIEYIAYQSELQMPAMMELFQKDLSEPYSIYTYRYFIHNWPNLCFLAMAPKSSSASFDSSVTSASSTSLGSQKLTAGNTPREVDSGSFGENYHRTRSISPDSFDVSKKLDAAKSNARSEFCERNEGCADDSIGCALPVAVSTVPANADLAENDKVCVGAIVCKLDEYPGRTLARDDADAEMWASDRRGGQMRGYIAMLAVEAGYRKRKIASNLVLTAIRAMVANHADEVVLETEITNQPALRLYENLGFVRDKRLFRYYLNGVDAFRLKLWLR